MQDALPLPPITTQELRIVDAQGHPRMILSAKDGRPVIMLLGSDAKQAASIALDAQDHPSIRLANPDASGAVAAIEVDDKGAHVKFDRPGGASSYLFLNDAGASGVVLIDGKGVRRASAILSADGMLAVTGEPGGTGKH